MGIIPSILAAASVLNLLAAAPVINKSEVPAATDDGLDPATYLGPEDYAFYKEYMASLGQQNAEASWNSWDGNSSTWEANAWEEPAWNQSGWFDPWSSPAQYVSMGGYYANIIQGWDQWIVDQPGTAAMFDLDGKIVIGDHASQGFRAIVWNNTADICGHKYRKVSQYNGFNDGYDIYVNGQPIGWITDGELVMYTCLDGGGENVKVTYWTAS